MKPILVVDDSAFDRTLLVKFLEKKTDYKILEADSGERCLEIVAQESIGLILMDIMMPGIHGTQILTKLREKFNLIELPVIMVTAKSDASDVIECLKSGANDYITKPVNFEIAISRITTHLTLSELSQKMSQLKEVAALDAMITTYNHEINNPLSIAIACLDTPPLDEVRIEKLKTALWRVAEIVKKIRSVTDKKQIDFQSYAGLMQMVKLQKD